jgi:hypothetical protein
MAYPIPGVKVFIESDAQLLEYLDSNGNIVNVVNEAVAVSNYDYEIKLNEEKRKLLLLRPEYVSVFVSDTRNMMKYDRSSQFEDRNTKRAFNPRNNR